MKHFIIPAFLICFISFWTTLIGLIEINRYGYMITQCSHAKSWKVTYGEIIYWEIRKQKSRHLKADVRYSYTVNQKTYNSRTYSTGFIDFRYKKSKEHYEKGDRVKVYYHPRRPEKSVLNHSDKQTKQAYKNNQIIFAISIFFFWVCLIFLMYMNKKLEKSD